MNILVGITFVGRFGSYDEYLLIEYTGLKTKNYPIQMEWGPDDSEFFSYVYDEDGYPTEINISNPPYVHVSDKIQIEYY